MAVVAVESNLLGGRHRAESTASSRNRCRSTRHDGPGLPAPFRSGRSEECPPTRTMEHGRGGSPDNLWDYRSRADISSTAAPAGVMPGDEGGRNGGFGGA